LLREVEALDAVDNAALWARRRLPAKNQLSASDAKQVEEAFAAKLASIHPQIAWIGETLSEKTSISEIGKSVLPFPEPRRIRHREHVRHVIKQPCLVCGRRPSDPHHLRFAQSRALGRKVSDEFTVPLCRTHHREVHRCGNEELWWRKTGIDPLATARAFWLETHPLGQWEPTVANMKAPEQWLGQFAKISRSLQSLPLESQLGRTVTETAASILARRSPRTLQRLTPYLFLLPALAALAL
jgi:hypothetical protein